MADKPLHPAQIKPLLSLKDASVKACRFHSTHRPDASIYPYRLSDVTKGTTTVHYLRITGPEHPTNYHDVGVPGDIYIQSLSGQESCYSKTDKGWKWWDPLALEAVTLVSSSQLTSHPYCTDLFMWCDGRKVGWYSLDNISQKRQKMTRSGLFDTDNGYNASAHSIVSAMLLNQTKRHGTKRPRAEPEDTESSAAGVQPRSSKKPKPNPTTPGVVRNTSASAIETQQLQERPRASLPSTLAIASAEPGTSSMQKTALRSDTPLAPIAKSSDWQAERDTLLQKISDLNTEVQELRNANVSSTLVEVGTSTEGLDSSASCEMAMVQKPSDTLSTQILGIFAASMTDPGTIKAIGLGERLCISQLSFLCSLSSAIFRAE